MEDKLVKAFSKDRNSENSIDALARNIRRERVPPHLLDLANELQAALDAREKNDT